MRWCDDDAGDGANDDSNHTKVRLFLLFFDFSGVLDDTGRRENAPALNAYTQ